MKFNETLISELDLEAQEKREPVNIMPVREVLTFLKESSEHLIQKSHLYKETSDPDIQLDCIDIASVKLNDFTQAFRDLVVFMGRDAKTFKGSNSLRHCISSYDTFIFHQSEEERCFLRELLLRNEITHDYFNRELHRQKLIWMMENCCVGSLDVYYNLYRYCKKHNLIDRYVDKNRR